MTRYTTTLTGGPLMLPESRRLAGLLLAGADAATRQQALYVDNLLQKTSPATVRKVAQVALARLRLLPPQGWELVANGAAEAASQALLVAVLRQSPLLADFLERVVGEHRRRMDAAIARRDWEPFLADCAAREPHVAGWSASTRAKLWEVAVRCLVDARYLDSHKTLALRRPALHPDVRALIKTMGEHQMIELLEPAR